MKIRLSMSELKSARDKMFHVGQALNRLQSYPLTPNKLCETYGYDTLDEAIRPFEKEQKEPKEPKEQERDKSSSDVDDVKNIQPLLMSHSFENMQDDIILPALTEYAIKTKSKRTRSRQVVSESKILENETTDVSSKHKTVIETFLNCEKLIFEKLFNATFSSISNQESPEANILRSIFTLDNNLKEEEIRDVLNTIVENLRALKGSSDVDKRVFATKVAIALLSFSDVSNLYTKASSIEENKTSVNNKQMISQEMLLPFLQMAAGENININSQENILDLAIRYYSIKPELHSNQEGNEEQERDLIKYYKNFLKMLFKSYVNSAKPFAYQKFGYKYTFNDTKENHDALIHFGQAFLKLGQLDKNKSLFADVINTFIEELEKNPVNGTIPEKQTTTIDPEEEAYNTPQKIADMFLSPLLAKIKKYDDTFKGSKVAGDIYRDPNYPFLKDLRFKITDSLLKRDRKSFFAVIEAVSAIDEFYMKAMSMPNNNDPLEKYHKEAIEKCEAVYPPSVRNKVSVKTTVLKVLVATLSVVLVTAAIAAILVYAAPLIPIVGGLIALSLHPALGIGFLGGACVGKRVYNKMTQYMKQKSSFHTPTNKSALSFFNKAKKTYDDKLPKVESGSKKNKIAKGTAEMVDEMFNEKVMKLAPF